MKLTDQQFWHILQVKPETEHKTCEGDSTIPVGHDWIEWAKTEILSGVGVVSSSEINFQRCSVYLARLLRVLDQLPNCSIVQRRQGEDGGVMYAESYVKELLMNGLEACGCSSDKVQNALWVATKDGFLSEHEFDEWRPGLRSGLGWRKYYGLTFRGTKQAEQASVLTPVCEADSDKAIHDCDVREVKAESTDLKNLKGRSERAATRPAESEAAPAEPPPAFPTPELEAEIIRILSGEMGKTVARPTYSEFYQQHVINGRTMRGLARANGWSERTMKGRKARIEAYLSQKLSTKVDLDVLRNAPRRSGRVVYKDPSVIDSTHSNGTRHDED